MLTTKCDVDHCTFLLFGKVIAHKCKGICMFTEMSIGIDNG